MLSMSPVLTLDDRVVVVPRGSYSVAVTERCSSHEESSISTVSLFSLLSNELPAAASVSRATTSSSRFTTLRELARTPRGRTSMGTTMSPPRTPALSMRPPGLGVDDDSDISDEDDDFSSISGEQTTKEFTPLYARFPAYSRNSRPKRPTEVERVKEQAREQLLTLDALIPQKPSSPVEKPTQRGEQPKKNKQQKPRKYVCRFTIGVPESFSDAQVKTLRQKIIGSGGKNMKSIIKHCPSAKLRLLGRGCGSEEEGAASASASASTRRGTHAQQNMQLYLSCINEKEYKMAEKHVNVLLNGIGAISFFSVVHTHKA